MISFTGCLNHGRYAFNRGPQTARASKDLQNQNRDHKGWGWSHHPFPGERVDVTVCLGDEQVTHYCKVLDTDAFDIVITTDFLRRNPKVKLLSLRRPYALHCDFGSALFSVPPKLSVRKESGLRYVNRSYRTENYQLGRPLLESGLAAVQVDLNQVQVESFASKEQHMMQVYCSRYLGKAYGFHWRFMGLCYVLTPYSANSLRC